MRAAIYATGPGTVRFAGWKGGYGNLIEVEHANGIRTRYGHLSGIGVAPGQAVRQGQKIGEMGSTGRSTGVHLHYEVRVHGVAVNPLEHMNGGAAGGFEVEQVRWEPEAGAKDRWAGWSTAPGAATLPQSVTR